MIDESSLTLTFTSFIFSRRTQINFTVAIDFTASNGEWVKSSLLSLSVHQTCMLNWMHDLCLLICPSSFIYHSFIPPPVNQPGKKERQCWEVKVLWAQRSICELITRHGVRFLMSWVYLYGFFFFNMLHHRSRSLLFILLLDTSRFFLSTNDVAPASTVYMSKNSTLL